MLIAPMATAGAEPIGSMGTDTPVAVLSKRPRLLFDYFTELFAQVTNPPLDAIREELVTSLAGGIGPEQNLLDPGPASCRQIVIPRPVIDNDELAKIWHINADGDMPGFRCQLIDGRYRVHGGGEALAAALERVRRECSAAVEAGARILILSDRDCDPDHAPIPSLLLTSAVHQHLVRTGQRTQVGLVVETGEAREVHHVALLIGYGAAAVNPYLAFETIDDLVANGAHRRRRRAEKAIANYVKALSKGVLKVMSKMGISTIQSYTGAQVFEAFGLSQALVDEYFGGTPSRLGGVGLAELAGRVRRPGTSRAFPLVDDRPARTAASTSAASTSGGARASCTCSTPRPSSCCSTRPAPASTTSSASTPTRSTSSTATAARCAGCSSSSRACARRCRSTRSSRWPRSSPASPPARCPTARSRPRRTRRSRSR